MINPLPLVSCGYGWAPAIRPPPGEMIVDAGPIHSEGAREKQLLEGNRTEPDAGQSREIPDALDVAWR